MTTGTNGDDVLVGGAGSDLLEGLAGNDFLDGAAGIDTMYGGAGSDIYIVDHSSDEAIEVAAGDGFDVVRSSATFTIGAFIENLILTGAAAIDGTGNDLANKIIGNSAANRLDGGAGSDTMKGGAGDDTYVVDRSGDRVVELAAGDGTDLVLSSASFTLESHVENLTLVGTDAINGTGNTLSNILVGNEAANILNGGVGADAMSGGAGDDTYFVDNAGDQVTELFAGHGTDLVRSSISFSLGAHVENLTLTGNSAIDGTGNSLANILIGNAAANFLDGGSGADTMKGGAGNDSYVVDDSGDRAVETSSGHGIDLVSSSVSFTLGSHVENLTLTGLAAIDATGNSLANVLTGNAAANVLNGAAGADTMTGNAGNDTYFVDSAGDQAIETLAGDGIDLVNSSVTFTLGNFVENLTLIGGAAINGTGNAVANKINGNNAANVLDGAGGADTMKGAGGNDTYFVDHSGDQVVETSSGHGVDLVNSSITFTLGDFVENLTLTGVGAINGTGNSLANILVGNAAGNVLDGAAGADSMTGGAGGDIYVVDNAGDQAIETSADDGLDLVSSSVSFTLGDFVENLTLTGGAAINGTGNALANKITGNGAANTLDGAGGADTMKGGAGNDTYFVDHAGDQAVETSSGHGVDVVNSSASFTLGDHVENLTLTGLAAIDGTGNSLANVLIGNAAANILNGAAGADTMTGGAGDDTYFIDIAGDQIVESDGGGTDTVRSAIDLALGANLENLVLTGSAAIDGTGNALANEITGNSAANQLDGGLGADTMIGGGGNDLYLVDDAGDQAIETSGSGGTDVVNSAVGFTLGANVENLVLTGTAAIDGTGNALANQITGNEAANQLDGGAGADTMTGGGGDDTYSVDNAGDLTIETAGGGTDTIRSAIDLTLGANLENLVLTGAAAIDGVGNALANQLTGNDAANQLDGGAGADTMNGAGGNDTYFVDHAGDLVVEAAGGGTDTVRSAIDITLAANVENLVLTGAAAIDGIGNANANHLTGNSAANTLEGGLGADTLEGGGGDDVYTVDDLGDVVIEAGAAGGTDAVNSSVDFTLGANLEYLYLNGVAAIDGTGNALDNIITGNESANLLAGAAGADTLNGQGGNDVLNGGTGQDMLTGGGGSDGFEFTAALLAANVDTVIDFDAATDEIRLGGAAGQPFAALATGALGAAAFRIGSAAADGDDRIIYDSLTGALLYDADGAGGAAAQQIAWLGSDLELTQANFTVTGPANNLPTISSGTTASVEENSATSTIVYQTVASDSDGDTIVYSLTGTDAAAFTIDQSGAVRFVASPDFEAQNSYSFTVRAFDSSGTGASRTVSLSVTDIAESVEPYLVNEIGGANDNRFDAQFLDRNLFTVADSPNVPDDSLPTAIISGNVSIPGDKDFFSITLQQGELLILDIDGTDTLDAWVTVYDASGNIITFNDDPGGPFDPGSVPHPGVGHNMDSFIRVRAPTDGTYYISVESFFDDTGPSSDGEYTLNVSIGPVATQAQIDDENIDALISGESWSTLNLTFGFPNSPGDYPFGEGSTEIDAGMQPLDGQQRGAVRTILGQFANLTNLNFTEQTFNPGSADLRYALSNEPDTAYAYYPGPGDGGDSWYNTTEYTGPARGNYEWLTFVHETGHALGLKHGHESPALSPDRDSLEFSVMTYRSYIGDSVNDGTGYTNETWGFPQTLMMYDIAALQRMYGADFSYNSGDTTYRWDPSNGAFSIDGNVQWTPGGNRVFMTVWDGGGEDTYDLSNYSGAVEIDLRPGFWSITSNMQIANLGNGNFARGNVFNALLHNDDPRSLIENAIGGASGDRITANQAANELTGGGGDDWFIFNAVSDSAVGAADRITDFVTGGGEKIRLESIDANTNTESNDSFAFIGTNAFTGTAGELRYEQQGADLHIFGDVNGDAVADLEIIVSNQTVLTTNEFFL